MDKITEVSRAYEKVVKVMMDHFDPDKHEQFERCICCQDLLAKARALTAQAQITPQRSPVALPRQEINE